MKCTRVITKTKEVTDDRTEAEREIDVTVMGMHANWVAAKCVQQGDLKGAIDNNQKYSDLLHNNIEDETDAAGAAVWFSERAAYDDHLTTLQAHQASEHTESDLDSGNFLTPVVNLISSTFGGRPAPSKPSADDDETQNMTYARRNAKKNKGKWNERRKY